MRTGAGQAMRRRSYLPVLALFLVGTFTWFSYKNLAVKFAHRRPASEEADWQSSGSLEPLADFPDPPLPTLSNAAVVETHPIRKLITEASAEFDHVLRNQSKTLSEAVAEYKRRHGIPPPPNFDKWFQFAQERSVKLIDEYDSIMDSLMPFWGLPPATVRARAREALGYDQALLALLIRGGKITSPTDGWQLEATAGMMEKWVQWLPDMDLAFNIHDEPRVVVPSDDLARLVARGKKEMAAAGSAPQHSRDWSEKAGDLDYERRVPDSATTRFNMYAHQATWTNSRLSCPPESPSRSLDEVTEDDIGAYTDSPLSLIRNHTAFSDICNSPSFKDTYGFFVLPNAYKVVHDLFPIFSQSKISSYQDILYPSPWYWYGKVEYQLSQDRDWDRKADQLYWRGSSTGGFSRNGGWRRQHRQQVVRNFNSKAIARYYEHPAPEEGGPPLDTWSIREASREQFRELFNVRFTGFGQCDDNDCKAQENFFGKAPWTPQNDAWKYKYLLDVDGNAFSGRFYAFLHSRSAVFKIAIFREWHDGDGWIRPWVHYVPMTLNGHEYVETMRYFSKEEEGQVLINQMAETSRKWTNEALRNDDFEVWFFRLLLEYGRVVDDRRTEIGFSL